MSEKKLDYDELMAEFRAGYEKRKSEGPHTGISRQVEVMIRMFVRILNERDQ